MTSCVYIITDVTETRKTVTHFKCWICFCPAGDEPHQPLSRALTVPGKTALPPHPDPPGLTPSPELTSASGFSVAPLSSLDFNSGGPKLQTANANKELPAAVPVDSRRRRLRLLLASAFAASGTEQEGEGARQERRGPDEEWGEQISTGQKGLGVEPVLCAGGIHGVRPAVRGQGKDG